MKAGLRTFASVASAVALAASTSTAWAQVAEPADSPAAASDDQEIEEIIVIGTAGAGTRRQDAAFAVTTVDAAAIDQISPASTADLFKAIPGVTAESSGGQAGANIFVRGYPSAGDSEFVTLQTEGVPFFPPSTLSFLDNAQLFRIDETIERVEAVRGGTGSLFSTGQPGLTVNFVQRRGGSEFEGLAKISATDYGEVRGDGYISGPLGPSTGFMVGGYYASSNGIRDPQFTAERGGQISANVTHDFGRGKLLVFGRYLDDRGQWLLPIPVVQDGDDIRAFPGFDAGTGTLASNELRLTTLNTGEQLDLADGRGAKIVSLGTNFEYELAERFTLRNRASFLKGDADTTGLVPGGAAPQTATSFAAGLGGTISSLTFVNGGLAAPESTQVIQTGAWRVRKQLESFVNDLGLEFKSGNNTLTVGGYFASYSSSDQWSLGNLQLVTAEPNARRLNLTIINTTPGPNLGATQQVTRGGVAGGAFFNVNASYDARDVALYAVDEFQITPELRIDGGVRWARTDVDGTVENNTFGIDTDNDPNTLFNNGTAILNGTFSTIDFNDDKFSFTLGANFDVTSDLGVFARFSRGHAFPFFDNLRDGARQTRKVDTYEAGAKLSTDLVSAYATVFRNEFTGLAATVIVDGAPLVSIGGGKTTGVEVEGAIRPIEGLSIAFAGTYLDSKYDNFFNAAGDDLTGNTVQRQPEWQWRINPSYEATFGNSSATLYTTIAYLGDRFSNPENTQALPSFYKWDAGVIVSIDDRIELQASVDNLTDEIGLTEGNPRNIGAQGSGAILARPILGRSFRFSVGYKF